MDVSDGLEEEPMECPGKSDLLCIGGFSKNFLVFNERRDCLKNERNINKHFTKNKKQATIKDFFKL